MRIFILLLLLSRSLFALPFVQVQIVTSGDMSAASIFSNGVGVEQLINASIQCTFTGTPVGTMKLQISDDIVPYSQSGNPSANVTHWSDYSGSSQSIAAAGDFTYNLLDVGYHWIRLVYTRTSGSGTMNCNFSGKGR